MRRSETWAKAAALLACALVALAAAAGASAASSSEIYRDYADNGKIDGHYSRADLRRALRDVQIQGYGKPGVKPAITRSLAATSATARTGSNKGGLPFTGFDLALMALGGAALLTVGAGFRKLGKAKQTAS